MNAGQEKYPHLGLVSDLRYFWRLIKESSERLGKEVNTKPLCLSEIFVLVNGNPLQCSCLENPRDGGAWWTAVYGGRTESDTTEAT